MHNKILLIGKSFGNYKNGSVLAYYNLSKRFPIFLDYIDGSFITQNKFYNILNEYKKVIICAQNHLLYPFHIDIKTFFKKKFMYFTRHKNIALYPNSITNGFSVYNSWKKHKNFILTFTTNFTKDTYNIQKFNLGYYYRSNNIDSYYYFLNMLEQYKKQVDITFCGDKPNYKDILYKCKNVKSIVHTTDMNYFFKKISHYVMPMSAKFIDPFPHTLLEAIHHHKQIVSPKLSNRNHYDGIDDILSFIKYHNSINDKIYYNNDNCGLEFNNFKSYYIKVLENNFSYKLEYNKYKTLYDWCAHEL